MFRTLRLGGVDAASLERVRRLGPYLESLYISGAKLKRLPPHLFSWLPRLQWLDLRDNYLIGQIHGPNGLAVTDGRPLLC